jgi:hypothetical protein
MRALVAILSALVFGAASQNAPGSRTLPKGVKSVTFGTAHRYYGPGKEMCVIVYPMPRGVFDRGATEISYAVELEPLVVKQAAARVTARSPQPLRSVPCNVFTPVRGGFSQTQLGSTISRIDKAPLEPGTYTLRVEVDGQIAEVPFIVK